MKKIEIYWQDLTEKAQKDILELLGGSGRKSQLGYVSNGDHRDRRGG